MPPSVQIPSRAPNARGRLFHLVFLGTLLAIAAFVPSACKRSSTETSPPQPSTVDRETGQRVYAPVFLKFLSSPPAPAVSKLPPNLRKVTVASGGARHPNVEQGDYQVTLDLSHQMLDLSVPKEVGFGDKNGEVEADLLPSFSQAAVWEHDFAPAAALALKAKQFDDGLYACVEIAADAGAGRFPAKKELLLKLLQSLKGESDQSAAALLTAAARLGGQQPQVSAEVSRQADKLQQEFLADSLASEVLGFYSWSDVLAQIFRRDRALQKQIDESTARAMAAALARDDKLLTAYTSQLSLTEKLTNPLAWNDLRDAARVLRGKGMPTFPSPISLFPPSRSPEVDLFNKLFGSGNKAVPEGFDLADEMVKRIRTRNLDLKPTPNSGWYDYQTYALEPLAIPEKMPEGEHLRFNESYRKLLVGLFKGLAALTRETHVAQHEIGGLITAVPPKPPPPLMMSPGLTVEPLATYYLRRAQSYRFIHDVIQQAFGPKELAAMRRLTAAGPVNLSLEEELRLMEMLFYGAYSRACGEMGMTAEPYPDRGNPKGANASGSVLGAWLASLGEDPDLGQDIRMMVPVFFDRDRMKTKAWVVLGIATTPLSVSYVTPPAIKEIQGPDGKFYKPEEAHVDFVGEEHRIAYIVSSEVYVSRVLNRTEFREHCDRYKTYKEILSHLR